MSELRIALVVEGPTDAIVLEAALEAILEERTFVVDTLQPRRDDQLAQGRGEGWGGVFRWCCERVQPGMPTMAADPTLADKHLIIVHLDADVAEKTYADLGRECEGFHGLPCNRPCPPAADTVAALETVVRQWLVGDPLEKTVICIPSRSIETWLVPVLFDSPERMVHLECQKVEPRLTSKQAGKLVRSSEGRWKKNTRNYQAKKALLTEGWSKTRDVCATAAEFERRVRSVLLC